MMQPVFQVYHKKYDDVFAVCNIQWTTASGDLIISRIDIITAPHIPKTYRLQPNDGEGDLKDLTIQPFKQWRKYA